MDRQSNEFSRASVSITVDAVTFQLQEPHSFAWLHELGSVFCVFDQQDSGNISFGVEQAGKKKFVKYAGARPLDFKGEPQEAVSRLLAAVPLYTALEHPHLIWLIDHYPVGNGYVTVFDWFAGECLHPHWSFPPPAKYTHPDSPFYRYRQLPLEKRLESLEAIFSFHAEVEARGYVAVDFYDGSILYDFSNHITKVCDIDYYREAPVVNDIGENFWGSKRFKAPEEYVLGASIDAKTNVFTLGATAFGLLGGEMDRSFSKWEAGPSLYEVVVRAVSEDRELRHESIRAFKASWDAAQRRS